jgi:hypothetical protein
MIKKYIKKVKASEAALPPEQRESDEVLQNQILDKFVEYSGGKKKGHVRGQGCTSSFIWRTPVGYMDVSSQSFNSSSSMSTGRSAPVESHEEFEQRLRAEHQESMKILREDLMAEWEQRVQGQHQHSNNFNVSNNLGNQSNQQQGAWNQGGEVPFTSTGINFNQSGGNTFINQHGARALGIIHGGSINEFNAGSRRTSARRGRKCKWRKDKRKCWRKDKRKKRRTDKRKCINEYLCML